MRTFREGRGVSTSGAADVDMVIIHSAQQVVDGWLRDDGRRPFKQTILRAEAELWDTSAKHAGQRRAFRKVANAIRLGFGHASANPEPLLTIVHTELAS